jgi:hypothetical protein
LTSGSKKEERGRAERINIKNKSAEKFSNLAKDINLQIQNAEL